MPNPARNGSPAATSGSRIRPTKSLPTYTVASPGRSTSFALVGQPRQAIDVRSQVRALPWRSSPPGARCEPPRAIADHCRDGIFKGTAMGNETLGPSFAAACGWFAPLPSATRSSRGLTACGRLVEQSGSSRLRLLQRAPCLPCHRPSRQYRRLSVSWPMSRAFLPIFLVSDSCEVTISSPSLTRRPGRVV